MKLPLYLQTYNSPFKPLKLKFYFGKAKLGVPYFLPRKWVKITNEEALEKATEATLRKGFFYGKDPNTIIDKFSNRTKAVNKKIGFDFIGLGWKTKFNSYRFETNPIWSFVFFNYQFAITFDTDHQTQYWESFLYYYFETDKSKSKKERIIQCIKKNPCIWTSSVNGERVSTDYYKLILKEKYFYDDVKIRDEKLNNILK
jgi:hypothetical protein